MFSFAVLMVFTPCCERVRESGALPFEVLSSGLLGGPCAATIVRLKAHEEGVFVVYELRGVYPNPI